MSLKLRTGRTGRVFIGGEGIDEKAYIPTFPTTCPKCEPSTLVYYNASLFNPTTSGVIPAAIDDTRSQAIIKRPDEWQCSIVRFDLSANQLPPIVLPMPQPPVAGANVPSLLTVTLSYLGADYQQTVLVDSLSISTYGFLYSYDELTKRINAALATAFALIPGPSSTAPPVLVFNAITQMFVLFYQATYVTAGNPIQIWLNHVAYKYVESLPAFFASYNQPLGKDFRLQVEVDSALTLPAVGARAGYPSIVQAIAGEVRSITQVAPSLSSTNGVRSIVITTTMPIVSENLPTSTGSIQNQSYSSNSLPVLTDFLLTAEPGANPVQDRISVAYLPTAEYRMVQMRGNEALTRIDLKFFFTLFDGSLRELTLPPGGYLSAKLLFRRAHDHSH